MARYIDADALRKHVRLHCGDCGDAIECIAEAPTENVVSASAYDQVRWERDVAIEQLESYSVSLGEKAEVAKVVHGRWERVIPTKSAAKWSKKVSCSVCHRGGYAYHNYCPNCGAKMDGERNCDA